LDTTKREQYLSDADFQEVGSPGDKKESLNSNSVSYIPYFISAADLQEVGSPGDKKRGREDGRD
jgi:hypothetical protein